MRANKSPLVKCPLNRIPKGQWADQAMVEGRAYFSQVALLEYLQIKLELGSEIFRTEHESEFFDGFEMDDLLN